MCVANLLLLQDYARNYYKKIEIVLKKSILYSQHIDTSYILRNHRIIALITGAGSVQPYTRQSGFFQFRGVYLGMLERMEEIPHSTDLTTQKLFNFFTSFCESLVLRTDACGCVCLLHPHVPKEHNYSNMGTIQYVPFAEKAVSGLARKTDCPAAYCHP